MAKYNPFAEKVGMQKIAEQPPSKEALKIAETLRQLGFNIQLLGSEKYVLSKLQALNHKDIAKIKEAFFKYCYARLMKYFFCHMPFGKKQAYVEEIRNEGLSILVEHLNWCKIKFSPVS